MQTTNMCTHTYLKKINCYVVARTARVHQLHNNLLATNTAAITSATTTNTATTSLSTLTNRTKACIIVNVQKYCLHVPCMTTCS